MNTSKLKKFAPETRRKLLKQVNGKLEHVLSADNGALRDKTHVLYDLKKELKRMGRNALVDKVAYTWFNRFAALRYMGTGLSAAGDINTYTSGRTGFTADLAGSDGRAYSR